MTSDYASALGARLRAIRTQQGLSLHGVEKKSKGRWKAVVVGSYERGDRAVTVQKLAELADFYGVPVSELLPEGRAARRRTPGPEDRARPASGSSSCRRTRSARSPGTPQAIQSQRGDYNDKVLSIRGGGPAVARRSSTTSSEGELTDRLIEWGVLAPDARSIDPADRRPPTACRPTRTPLTAPVSGGPRPADDRLRLRRRTRGAARPDAQGAGGGGRVARAVAGRGRARR